jgi:hypothetical protein
MSLFEIYKTESFPNQYYEIPRAPFVVMGIPKAIFLNNGKY